MEDMELSGGRVGIEGLHRGLHSDYIVRRESPFGQIFSTEISLFLTYILIYFKELCKRMDDINKDDCVVQI